MPPTDGHASPPLCMVSECQNVVLGAGERNWKIVSCGASLAFTPDE